MGGVGEGEQSLLDLTLTPALSLRGRGLIILSEINTRAIFK
jgi:hypothetical protein